MWRLWSVHGGGGLYLEEVACTCSPWLLRGGGGLYMKAVVCTWRLLPVFCTWRRWPVLAHRSFYVEAWPVHEGGGLYVEVGSCIWRRLPVLAHRGFYMEHGPYMKAVACM